MARVSSSVSGRRSQKENIKVSAVAVNPTHPHLAVPCQVPKPLIERKRRARINQSLDQLEKLLADLICVEVSVMLLMMMVLTILRRLD